MKNVSNKMIIMFKRLKNHGIGKLFTFEAKDI